MSTAELRKAAIVLMSLPEEQAAGLLARLEPSQAEAVTIEIAHGKPLGTDEQWTALREFAEVDATRLGGKAGWPLAKTLLERAFGRQTRTLDAVRQASGNLPFAFLRHIDASMIVPYLRDEHPQIVAVVLSHLPAGRAAEIMAGLPTELQLNAVRRIAVMRPLSPEIVREVERALERRMTPVAGQTYAEPGGISAVARILEAVDRTTQRGVLESLAERDARLLEELRQLIFVFEDLARLSSVDLQIVLQHVPLSQWAIALKGASESLVQKIVGNMLPGTGDLLQEEINSLVAVSTSAIEAAQQQIVDVVRHLQESGELRNSSLDELEIAAR